MCVCGNPDCKIEYGICHCGCGGETPIAKYSSVERCWVEGKPTICRLGHRRVSQPRPPIEQPDDPLIRHIPLSQGLYAIVDACKYDWLMRWRWHAYYDPKMGSYYATRRRKCRDWQGSSHVSMHSYLLPVPPGFVVDHENKNTLDNRDCNLRQATHEGNARNQKIRKCNTTGVTGVHMVVTGKGEVAYVVRIVIDGKRKTLGRRSRLDDAAKLRRDAELLHYGRFAPNQNN